MSAQHVKTGMIFGTTLKNSSTVVNKPPADEILLHGHGRLIRHNKKRHYYGSGMGANNTTHLVIPKSGRRRNSKQQRIGRRGYEGENRSYANRIAHDLIVDTNPYLTEGVAKSDPLKFVHSKWVSDKIFKPRFKNRMVYANYKNARAYLKQYPHSAGRLRHTWYMDSRAMT